MARKRTTPKPEAAPELTTQRVRQLIHDENPGAKINDVETYAHQFLTYREETRGRNPGTHIY